MELINLLPWRQEVYNAKRRAIVQTAIAIVCLGLVIVFIMRLFIAPFVSAQTARNEYLQHAIDNVNTQIQQLQAEQIDDKPLLDEAMGLKKLSESRFKALNTINELLKILPNGIVLTKLSWNNDEVVLTGTSTSDMSITQLMSEVNASKWLKNPILHELKKYSDSNTQKQFNLNISYFNG